MVSEAASARRSPTPYKTDTRAASRAARAISESRAQAAKRQPIAAYHLEIGGALIVRRVDVAKPPRFAQHASERREQLVRRRRRVTVRQFGADGCRMLIAELSPVQLVSAEPAARREPSDRLERTAHRPPRAGTQAGEIDARRLAIERDVRSAIELDVAQCGQHLHGRFHAALSDAFGKSH
jgi:hypothetical protein